MGLRLDSLEAKRRGEGESKPSSVLSPLHMGLVSYGDFMDFMNYQSTSMDKNLQNLCSFLSGIFTIYQCIKHQWILSVSIYICTVSFISNRIPDSVEAFILLFHHCSSQ